MATLRGVSRAVAFALALGSMAVVWAEPAPATPVTVAVVDCGLPDAVSAPLAVGPRVNFGPGSPHPDKCTHGAAMASSILEGFTAAGPLTQPVAVQIIDVRVLGDDGRGRASDLVSGLRWAATSGARVVNLSVSFQGMCSSEMRAAIADLVAQGSLVVAATGNDGTTTLTAPANCPGVLPVTAMMNGVVPAFATRSPDVPLAAPATGVWTMQISTGAAQVGNFQTGVQLGNLQAGTSWSSAYTAGVAARLLSESPELSAATVRGLLVDSSAPLLQPSGSTRRVDPPGALALLTQQNGQVVPALPASDRVTVPGEATQNAATHAPALPLDNNPDELEQTAAQGPEE